MSIVMRVNNFARSDQESGTNTNVVTAVVSGQVGVRKDYRTLEWAETTPDGARPLATAHDVRSALMRVLDEAEARPGGTVQLELVGERLFAVPRHRWPSFEIVGSTR